MIFNNLLAEHQLSNRPAIFHTSIAIEHDVGRIAILLIEPRYTILQQLRETRECLPKQIHIHT